MQLRSGDDPRLQDTLKNASYRGGQAANDLIIPQPKVMVAYGLYGPAPAKQINNEIRQMHTYYNERPLGPRGSLLSCEPKCQHSRSATDCISPKCPQPQILQDLPRGTRAPQFIWVPGSRRQNSLHPRMGGPLIG